MSIKSKERKDNLGEVFTPDYIIDEMLDHVPQLLVDPDKTFLDPTCGNGNILVRILKTRLALGLDPIKSVSSLYGIDIMEDNVRDTHQRLEELVPEAKEIIRSNIIQHDITTFVFEDEYEEFDPLFDDKPRLKRKATDWSKCKIKY